MKDLLYLENILESIKIIESYISKKSFGDFKKSKMMKDAVSKRLEEIGENCRRVSKETKEKNKEIEWEGFIENRNFLTHVYHLVNEKRLWVLLKDELPVLKKQIKKAVKKIK